MASPSGPQAPPPPSPALATAAPPRTGSARPTASGGSFPLWQLTLTRFREFVREPEAVFWVFAFPIVLAVALGLAFREKPPDLIPIAVVQVAAPGPAVDPTAATLAALARSPVLLARAMAPAAAELALRSGKISLLVEPGVGGKPPVFRFDETRPDSRIARLEADDALERAAGRADRVPIRTEKVTEKGSRYIDFLIPGLLGMNLMGTGIWSLAFNISSARQKNLLKRLIATPMRRTDFLLAQILGRLVFLVPEMVALLGAGWLIFGVPLRGSLWLLLFTCLLGAISFCGLGLLVASRVRTPEGASGWANLVMIPMWLASGVFFSSERFPDHLQPFIKALPLTALNDALRGIMNEGWTAAQTASRLGILAAWGAACYIAALKVFRWR